MFFSIGSIWPLHYGILFIFHRLVMYIERDSRRQTPRTPKSKPLEAQEYLSQCLELLISGIVQRLPSVMGKLFKWCQSQLLSSLLFDLLLRFIKWIYAFSFFYFFTISYLRDLSIFFLVLHCLSGFLSLTSFVYTHCFKSFTFIISVLFQRLIHVVCPL